MLTIGLTGGIGSGKSTVTSLFKEQNIPVIDADEVAHNIVQPKQPALAEIRNTFGNRVITPDGSLDRDILREIVFRNKNEKLKLENILHPIIFKTMREQLNSINSPYGILSIPLLFETNYQQEVDRVLVIDCPESVQKKRIKGRDSLDDEMINSIIKSQCSREYKVKFADDVLINNGSLKDLKTRVQQLHKFYLGMSTGNK
ncbi:MAG: dephospho-CoA kinase [Cycloclasticus sp.]|nr:MAG: dephospho-CoA kinase [Cycloclasticus sp.]